MRNSYSVPFYPSKLTEDEKNKYFETLTRTNFPLSAAISLGEYPCSNNCRMCPHYGHELKTRNIMDDQTYSRVIDSLPKDLDYNLEISSYGETLDHPTAIEKIALAKKSLPQAKLVIATNGIPLNSKRIKALLDTGVDHVQVSLNAGSPETYKWLCGTDNYIRVAENLRELVNEAERGGYQTIITTHIIEIEELRQEFESFIQDWKDYVYSAEIRAYGNWGGLVDNNGCTSLRREPPERFPCLGLWGSIKILPNADAYKCFIHSVPSAQKDGYLGSILEENISSIWQGERAEYHRKLHLSGRFSELESCKGCKSWILMPNLWNKKNGDHSVTWSLP